MAQKYQSLKQEALIYEHITGKKCSIFHEETSFKKEMLKLPSAVNRRISTLGDSKQAASQYRKQGHNQSQKRRKTFANSSKKSTELYPFIVKQGIKFTLASENEVNRHNFRSKRNQTSNIRIKPNQNPQESSKIILQPLVNRYSEKKHSTFGINQKKYSQNAISSPSIHNQQSDVKVSQPNSPIFFSPIPNLKQINKQSKNVQTSLTQGIIGKSKKQRLKFQKLNKQENMLQLELKQYHDRTKNFIDQIKQKYSLNFSKPKKYLKNIKPSTKPYRQDLHQRYFLIDEALKYDQISQQITYLNFALKENTKKILNIEQQIKNNKYFEFFNQNIINQQTQNYEDQAKNAQSVIYQQKKTNFLEKLKQSLINLRLKNQQNQINRGNIRIQANQRLQKLLIHY